MVQFQATQLSTITDKLRYSKEICKNEKYNMSMLGIVVMRSNQMEYEGKYK